MLKISTFILIVLYSVAARGQQQISDIHFNVTSPQPSAHYFEVELKYKNPGDTLILKMPAWSPGGYFITEFGEQLANFSASGLNGQQFDWSRSGNNWTVITKRTNQVIVRYRINCVRPFIDMPWVEESWAMISPTGMFLYADKDLKHPVTITVSPLFEWSVPFATGLDNIPGMQNTFFADDFDILYDSPILMGNLESLPPVYIKNIPHYFIGRDLGIIDRKLFMFNLTKIMNEATGIIEDIPYKHYSFLSIGNGPGGLEHLNSTVVSFRSKNFLTTPETRFRNYRLLAHEFFHLYNAKRIRPVELGPFDYSGPNYTNLLWFAEGVTEYYAHLIVLRSGIGTIGEVNSSFQNIIRNYENKPGHLYQSLADASFTVWDNSPFSKTKAQADKTISYYEKGCVLGLLIDLDIRNRSGNKYSLDDVLRFLYKKYFQELKRGFTDKELKATCEFFAGSSMDEVFSYVYTTKVVNYPKFFRYAGLSIDTSMKTVSYLGLTTGVQLQNYMVLNSVEEEGPAWNAGLRVGDTLITMEGREPNIEVLNELILKKKPGEPIVFEIRKNGKLLTVPVILGSRKEKVFSIAEEKNKSKLQRKIYNSWKRGIAR